VPYALTGYPRLTSADGGRKLALVFDFEGTGGVPAAPLEQTGWSDRPFL